MPSESSIWEVPLVLIYAFIGAAVAGGLLMVPVYLFAGWPALLMIEPWGDRWFMSLLLIQHAVAGAGFVVWGVQPTERSRRVVAVALCVVVAVIVVGLYWIIPSHRQPWEVAFAIAAIVGAGVAATVVRDPLLPKCRWLWF